MASRPWLASARPVNTAWNDPRWPKPDRGTWTRAHPGATRHENQPTRGREGNDARGKAEKKQNGSGAPKGPQSGCREISWQEESKPPPTGLGKTGQEGKGPAPSPPFFAEATPEHLNPDAIRDDESTSAHPRQSPTKLLLL